MNIATKLKYYYISGSNNVDRAACGCDVTFKQINHQMALKLVTVN